MKLARYWTRGQGEVIDPSGERIRVVARGWSDESLEQARIRAGEIARRVAQRIISNPGQKNQYDYGDRPLPEPVIRQFNASAVVTRNSYGALVLNADNLMFIDVDKEDMQAPSAASTGGGGGLEEVLSGIFSLFGKQAPAVPAPPRQAPPTVLDTIRRVAERHSLSGRVYKTAAGHRVLITNTPFKAGTDATEKLLNEFGADRMYMRLCRVQESFRARLTPKPWRCDFRKPPVEFPFETARDEAAFREWEAEYNSRAADYATCRFLSAVGSGVVAPGLDELIRYHDQETRATSGLPLA
jgi:hypothetical protein